MISLGNFFFAKKGAKKTQYAALLLRGVLIFLAHKTARRNLADVAQVSGFLRCSPGAFQYSARPRFCH
jgi:hypothetical protein